MTKEEWIDYFCLVCDHQLSQEAKMPVVRGDNSVIYDPFMMFWELGI